MLCLLGNAPIGYACIWRANRSMSLFDRLFAIQKSRENLMQMVGYIREANIVPEASERELAIAKEWIAKM